MKPTVVTVTSIVDNIRRQGDESSHVLQCEAEATRNWMRERIESIKKQILENQPHNAQFLAKQSAKKKKASLTFSALTEEEIDFVHSLKVRELKSELKKVGTPIDGLKKDLRERLLSVMHARRIAEKEQLSKTNTNQSASDESAAVNAAATIIEEKGASSTDNSPGSEKDSLNGLPRAVECVDLTGEDDENMEDVEPSPKIECQLKDMVVEPSPKKLPADEITAFVPVNEVKTTQESSSRKDDEFSARKRIRSPIRMIQNAVTKLSPTGKSPKLTDSQGPSSCHKVSSGDEEEHQVKIENKESNMDVERSADILSKPKNLASKASKLLSAPAENLSSSKHGVISSYKKPTLTAEAQARRAKLAEIRGKSKPVHNTTGSKHDPSSVCGYAKNFSAIKTSQLANDDYKKRLLDTQMREMALGKSVSALAAHFSASKTVPCYQNKYQPESMQTSNSLSEQPVSATKKSPAILSPNNYEISDRESDSESDSENECQQKKKVPDWARGERLRTALEYQYTRGILEMDPDKIFGEVQTCDLDAIFSNKNRFRARTSSGNWTRDRATSAEKDAYKHAVRSAVTRA